MTSTTVRARSRTGTGSAYQSRAQSRELVPVLKKSTHTTNNFMTSREQEIKSTIEQFRMQGGDEGYKGGIISTRSGNDTSTRGSFGQLEREREEARRIRARAMMEEAWRKDGREQRRLLLAEDESTGGSDFQINHDCPLRNYCAISDRVREQFQFAYKQKTKLEETYIMGNRLIKFLSQVLPNHPHYLSKRPESTRQRVKIQHDLSTVREQVEEVALLLDKEFYRSLMEAQGLEFDEPISPDRTVERVRKVRFNLDLEKIEYDPNLDQGSEAFANFLDANISADSKDNVSDLALWEERDPEVELSFSSEGSSFDNFFESDPSSMTNFTSDASNEFSGDFASFDFDSSNAFSENFDGGWEHFGSSGQGSKSEQYLITEGVAEETAWPDIMEQFESLEVKNSDTSDENNLTEDTENVSNETANDSCLIDADNCDDDDDDTATEDSDQDIHHNVFDLKFDDISDFENDDGINGDISFVEKIARENFYKGIDELGGEDKDDDSATDSWAQDESERSEHPGETYNSTVADKSLQLSVASEEDGSDGSLFMDNISDADQDTSFDTFPKELDETNLSFDDQFGKDLAESSVDAHNAKVLFSKDISTMEIEPQTNDSLDYSAAPSEWDSGDFNYSESAVDFKDIHEDFDNSQIIAESPDDFNFDHFVERVNTSDGNEHDDYLHEMAKIEYCDQNAEVSACDSSGGGKTTSTAETLPLAADESDDGSSSSCELEDTGAQNQEGSVLGIVRRDTYIPTIDSPEKPPKKQIGEELDDLESRVRGLKEKLEDEMNSVEPDYPIQMSRKPMIDVDTNIVEVGNNVTPSYKGVASQSQDSSISDAPTSNHVKSSSPEREATPSAEEEAKSTKQSTSVVSQTRRHPTAARLKVLRQSNAWKRRYARTSKD